ncbi:transcriptional regulator [Thioclava sp. F36-7]|nr:transcriptional regulator [Thioclava sp. F36-7]
MDWNDLRFFLAVARSKSLSEAGRQLEVSTSTVARRIKFLEDSLRLKLFRHHHDGYALTQAGLDLLDPAESAEAQMRLVERSARRKDGELAGLVRIDVPELIGQKILLPELRGFYANYPNIRLDFRSSVLPVRLRAQESDIVVRLVRPERGNYRIRLVGKIGFGFFASQEYLIRHGTPRAESDLLRHRVIAWPDDLKFLTMSAWLQTVCPDLAPSMFLDSFKAHVEAAKHGFGIAALPYFAASAEGLVPVLTTIAPLKLDLWLLIHDRSPMTNSIRVTYDEILRILIRNQSRLEEFEQPTLPI